VIEVIGGWGPSCNVRFNEIHCDLLHKSSTKYRNAAQRKHFLIKTLDFIFINVLHVSTRSGPHRADKNIQKEASCVS
jgi:hypothetical protein